MHSIEDYLFIDCLFIDMSIEKKLSNLFLTLETIFPVDLSDAQVRKKGLIKVSLGGISRIFIDKKKEFDSDIVLKYDSNGNDIRANEIHQVDFFELPNGQKNIIITADMILIDVVIKEIHIQELV